MIHFVWYLLWGALGGILFLLGAHIWVHRNHDWHGHS
jgi:hypothetical protein